MSHLVAMLIVGEEGGCCKHNACMGDLYTSLSILLWTWNWSKKVSLQTHTISASSHRPVWGVLVLFQAIADDRAFPASLDRPDLRKPQESWTPSGEISLLAGAVLYKCPFHAAKFSLTGTQVSIFCSRVDLPMNWHSIKSYTLINYCSYVIYLNVYISYPKFQIKLSNQSSLGYTAWWWSGVMKAWDARRNTAGGKNSNHLAQPPAPTRRSWESLQESFFCLSGTGVGTTGPWF